MPGYIKLYRDLQFNKLWHEKPFTRGQAWVDMLFRCNHVCVQMPPQYQNIWVLRGQFLLSNLKLAEAWGWDEKKVRRFLKYLEEEKMLIHKPFNRFSIYEVINYSEYQSSENEGKLAENSGDELIPARVRKKSKNDRTQSGINKGVGGIGAEQTPNRRRADAEQTPTNNNDNNDKNDNKYIYSMGTSPTRKQFVIPSLEEVKAYCKERNNNVDAERWHDYYSSNGWRVGKNSMRDWRASVRTWEKESFKNQAVSNSKNTPRYMNFDQRKYDKDYFEKIYKAYDQ